MAASEYANADTDTNVTKRDLQSSVDELTDGNVRTIAQLEAAGRKSGGLGERLVAKIGSFCGSMPFVWIHVISYSAWLFYNSTPMFAHHPDPFPFTFLTLTVTLETIFISVFILISQTRERRLTEQRSHLALQINLLTEQETTKMLKVVQSVARKVGAHLDDDPEMAALQEATQPDRVVEQIYHANKSTPSEQSRNKGG
jgi:uncharacterized membrane protein